MKKVLFAEYVVTETQHSHGPNCDQAGREQGDRYPFLDSYFWSPARLPHW